MALPVLVRVLSARRIRGSAEGRRVYVSGELLPGGLFVTMVRNSVEGKGQGGKSTIVLVHGGTGFQRM